MISSTTSRKPISSIETEEGYYNYYQKKPAPNPLKLNRSNTWHSHDPSILSVPARSPSRIQHHHQLKLQEEEEELIKNHKFGIMMMMNHSEQSNNNNSDQTLNVDEAVQSFITEDLSLLDSFGQFPTTYNLSTDDKSHTKSDDSKLKDSPKIITSTSTSTSPELNNITPTSSMNTDSTTNTSPASSVDKPHNNNNNDNQLLTPPKIRKYPSIAGRLKSHFMKRSPSSGFPLSSHEQQQQPLRRPPLPNSAASSKRYSTTPTITMTFDSERQNSDSGSLTTTTTNSQEE